MHTFVLCLQVALAAVFTLAPAVTGQVGRRVLEESVMWGPFTGSNPSVDPSAAPTYGGIPSPTYGGESPGSSPSVYGGELSPSPHWNFPSPPVYSPPPPPPTPITLIFYTDYSQLEDPVRRDAFSLQCQAEIAASLGVPLESVVILSILPGSVVVRATVPGDSDPSQIAFSPAFTTEYGITSWLGVTDSVGETQPGNSDSSPSPVPLFSPQPMESPVPDVPVPVVPVPVVPEQPAPDTSSPEQSPPPARGVPIITLSTPPPPPPPDAATCLQGSVVATVATLFATLVIMGLML